MEKALLRLQTSLATNPQLWSRRRLLGSVIKASAAVAAVVAGLAAPTAAYAWSWNCCNLSYPWCDTGTVCPSCTPSDYEWTCPSGGCTYACHECYGCAGTTYCCREETPCSYGYLVSCP